MIHSDYDGETLPTDTSGAVRSNEAKHFRDETLIKA